MRIGEKIDVHSVKYDLALAHHWQVVDDGEQVEALEGGVADVDDVVTKAQIEGCRHEQGVIILPRRTFRALCGEGARRCHDVELRREGVSDELRSRSVARFDAGEHD